MKHNLQISESVENVKINYKKKIPFHAKIIKLYVKLKSYRSHVNMISPV